MHVQLQCNMFTWFSRKPHKIRLAYFDEICRVMSPQNKLHVLKIFFNYIHGQHWGQILCHLHQLGKFSKIFEILSSSGSASGESGSSWWHPEHACTNVHLDTKCQDLNNASCICVLVYFLSKKSIALQIDNAKSFHPEMPYSGLTLGIQEEKFKKICSKCTDCQTTHKDTLTRKKAQLSFQIKKVKHFLVPC